MTPLGHHGEGGVSAAVRARAGAVTSGNMGRDSRGSSRNGVEERERKIASAAVVVVGDSGSAVRGGGGRGRGAYDCSKNRPYSKGSHKGHAF